MEIEKKFLLKENGIVHVNKEIFHNLNYLQLETFLKGKRITQTYLHLNSLEGILEKLEIKLDFKPDEARVRKYGKEYFLTIKSKGNFERHEFEREITRNNYKELLKEEDKSLKKIRMVKSMYGFNVEIDSYKGRKLMTCEVEVNSKKDLAGIPNFGKDISGDKKYKNKNLAK